VVGAQNKHGRVLFCGGVACGLAKGFENAWFLVNGRVVIKNVISKSGRNKSNQNKK
jgi:hypothetical protein